MTKKEQYFQELFSTTKDVVIPDMFSLKTLYGNATDGKVYFDEKDLAYKFIDISKGLGKSSVRYFKLFSDKELEQPLPGFYKITINMDFLNQHGIISSPRDLSKYVIILYKELSLVTNDNELSKIKTERLPLENLDIPMSQLTALDFIAISLKRPISKNQLINKLIKNE